MKEEFSQQGAVIASLEAQADRYRASNQLEAADRLHFQLQKIKVGAVVFLWTIRRKGDT